MNRNFLKETGLTDEQIDKVFAEYGKDINSLKSDNETKTAKIKELESSLTKYADYDEISEFKAKYEELQTKYTADLAKSKLDNVITEKLYKSKAKNVDILRKSINYDSIKTDEKGNITGIDEQINAFKESDPYLFVSDKDGIPPLIKTGLGSDPKSEPVDDPISQAFRKKFL